MKLGSNVEEKIKDFFHHKWMNDKNIFLLTEEEQLIMEQLPRDAQVEIFQKFLYKDFLMQFRRFFRFRVWKLRYLCHSEGVEYMANKKLDMD